MITSLGRGQSLPQMSVIHTPTLRVKTPSLSDDESLMDTYGTHFGDPLLCPRVPATRPLNDGSRPRRVPGLSFHVARELELVPPNALPGAPASSRCAWAWPWGDRSPVGAGVAPA